MANIELDSALAGFQHIGGWFAIRGQQRCGHAEDVGADVSRAQNAGDHLLVGLVVEPAEIDHDGQVVALPCLDGLLHRNEVGLLPVFRLDADDDVAVLFNRLRERIEVHVVFVLLGHIVAVGHARSDNVYEGEDAGRGVVNDAATKLGKVAPTRGARIGDGGHAVWDGHDVGRDREVAVAPGVVAKSGEDVYVHVDKPGREIEAGDVYGLLGGAGRDSWFDGGNLAVANGYVTFRVHVVFRIQDLAIAQNEIVLLSMR